jgi:signal transduction histidine kinase
VLEYLCIIFPVCALGTAHLLRVRHLNQQLQASLEQRLADRTQERMRIARELHDSLFQGFQGMMFRLEAVRRLLPGRPEEAARHLEAAIDCGLEAINEGRHAVGELRVAAPTDSDLPQALADLCTEFEQIDNRPRSPDFQVLVQGRAALLQPIVRDEVYRIAREAVRNSFRHARAGLVEVEIVFAEKALTVRVRDDGIGIDTRVLEAGFRKGHWGLPGMRERAVGFGAELEVWSQRNAGTEIELRIDARIAYVRRPGALPGCIARES